MADQARAGVIVAESELCGPCSVGNCAGHGRSFVNGQLEPCAHEHPPRREIHQLRAVYDGGWWSIEVDCPDAHLGSNRPCAVWEDGDGSKRIDQCTFQQYATDCDPEEWLHGRIEFPAMPIIEGGSGEEWHAVAVVQ